MVIVSLTLSSGVTCCRTMLASEISRNAVFRSARYSSAKAELGRRRGFRHMSLCEYQHWHLATSAQGIALHHWFIKYVLSTHCRISCYKPTTFCCEKKLPLSARIVAKKW